MKKRSNIKWWETALMALVIIVITVAYALLENGTAAFAMPRVYITIAAVLVLVAVLAYFIGPLIEDWKHSGVKSKRIGSVVLRALYTTVLVCGFPVGVGYEDSQPLKVLGKALVFFVIFIVYGICTLPKTKP
ncbi:MAG: hypothetical protein LBC38_01440 [Oscillospiraceae bacterium]|jgi:hypothetical protein|nr:hypothetical protein [Oscillospiraceae bacterium]